MAYEQVLDALANSTRRGVLETLRRGPMTVGELAAFQPVSRPAVSQHLRVLEAAHLVRVRPEGNRRVYAIETKGLEELRKYLEGFWADALTAYADRVARLNQQEQE